MNKILGIMIVLFASIAYSAVYVTQDKSGATEYSDTPSGNSSQIQIPAVNSVTTTQPQPTPQISATPATPATATTPGANAAASTTLTYKFIEILSPKDGETIQNQPVIAVQMKVDPDLIPGDKIQLMLDGKPASAPTSTTYQEIANVERGAHNLYAVIIGKDNNGLKQSNPITINVHRNSLITSPQTKG